MGADNLKYDPALGVYDEASLRAAGRYWEALQYEINAREEWAEGEYWRCERMLIAVERAISAHDHGIDEDDRYYKKPDQQDEAAAEIGRLRGEVEQLRVHLAGCGVIAMCNTRESLAKQMPERGAYGWSVSLEDCRNAVEREMALRERLESTAPAMPNGVEADWKWTLQKAVSRNAGHRCEYRVAVEAVIASMNAKGRAADNRDAAGVDVRERDCTQEAADKFYQDGWNACLAANTPAAVPAGEAVAPACYGMRRKGAAAIIGIVPNKVAAKPATSETYLADYEEVPLYLHPPAPVQAAPQEGECAWNYDEDTDAWNGTCGSMWQFTAGDPDDNDMHYCPKCGKRCALQHRGDSQAVDRG